MKAKVFRFPKQWKNCGPNVYRGRNARFNLGRLLANTLCFNANMVLFDFCPVSEFANFRFIVCFFFRNASFLLNSALYGCVCVCGRSLDIIQNCSRRFVCHREFDDWFFFFLACHCHRCISLLFFFLSCLSCGWTLKWLHA